MRRYHGKLPRSKQLYFAYGSNLNVEQMLARCPRATPFVAMRLPKATLRFRLYADVAAHATDVCLGGLWWITPACERALDLYEGVDASLYEKRYMTINLRGESAPRRVLYYKMPRRGVMPPAERYLDVIAQGYRDFDLDLAYLDRAVRHSWADKDRTPHLDARYEKKGSPVLANAVDYTMF